MPAFKRIPPTAIVYTKRISKKHSRTVPPRRTNPGVDDPISVSAVRKILSQLQSYINSNRFSIAVLVIVVGGTTSLLWSPAPTCINVRHVDEVINCERSSRSTSQMSPVTLYQEIISTLCLSILLASIRHIGAALFNASHFQWIVNHIPSHIVGKKLRKHIPLLTTISDGKISDIVKKVAKRTPKWAIEIHCRRLILNNLPSFETVFYRIMPAYLAIRVVIYNIITRINVVDQPL